MRRRAAGRTPAAGSEELPPELSQSLSAQIKDLAELREQGILTEQEFAAEKKKLLGL
jgi:hypothetical protein